MHPARNGLHQHRTDKDQQLNTLWPALRKSNGWGLKRVWNIRTQMHVWKCKTKGCQNKLQAAPTQTANSTSCGRPTALRMSGSGKHRYAWDALRHHGRRTISNQQTRQRLVWNRSLGQLFQTLFQTPFQTKASFLKCVRVAPFQTFPSVSHPFQTPFQTPFHTHWNDTNKKQRLRLTRVLDERGLKHNKSYLNHVWNARFWLDACSQVWNGRKNVWNGYETNMTRQPGPFGESVGTSMLLEVSRRVATWRPQKLLCWFRIRFWLDASSQVWNGRKNVWNGYETNPTARPILGIGGTLNAALSFKEGRLTKTAAIFATTAHQRSSERHRGHEQQG